MKYNFPESPYWTYIRALEELDKEFQIKREFLRKDLRVAQNECKHEHTTYHPDPSGNNDSYTECDWCGKEI
jgi:hypothetical protein